MRKNFKRLSEENGCFNYAFYRKTYALGDEANNENLFEHYMDEGAALGYRPHVLIDPIYLGDKYGSVASKNPLVFLLQKLNKISSAHPVFDSNYYVKKYGKKNISGFASPFFHYLNYGSFNDWRPSNLFDPVYYANNNADLKNYKNGLVYHFLCHAINDWIDSGMSRNPVWWIDVGYLLSKNGIGTNYDIISYVINNDLVERVMPNYLFDSSDSFKSDNKNISSLLNTIKNFKKIDGAKYFAELFDKEYYLNIYSDLQKAKVNPILHFVGYGYRENRAHFTYNNLEGICIVTPDIIGPVKNGGIGTACYGLARYLGESNKKIFILYTGSMDLREFVYWKEKYKDWGITFDWINRLEKHDAINYGSNHDLNISIYVDRFLQKQKFKHIIFQDWKAHGFWAIRNKTLGLAYIDTTLSVNVHSPSKWQNDGMHLYPENISNETKNRWAEKETIRNADYAICPSDYMGRWLKENGYINQNTITIPNLYYSEAEVDLNDNVDFGHLVFFGRLEKRKGLDIFIKAIELLGDEIACKVKKISFLGKHATVDGMSSEILLKEFRNRWDGDVDVITNYSSDEALEYIYKNNGVAIIPSIMDNLPMVVIECITHGIPMLASNVGGIPEMLDHDSLFEPNAESLAALIKEYLNGNQQVHKAKYSLNVAKQEWDDFFDSQFSSVGEVKNEVKNGIYKRTRLSVIIPLYNHGKYVNSLLKKIEMQSIVPNEVIIVNDGSTDSDVKQVLSSVNEQQYSYDIRIYEIQNSGPGFARNYGASKASGDYLVFVDADNEPEENLIELLKTIVEQDTCDAVFLPFRIFNTEEVNIAEETETGRYIPLGNYDDGFLFENAIGDASVCVSRKIFNEIGGFPECRNCHEDWLFGVKLVLMNKNITSINIPLIKYREMTDSRRKGISNYSSLEEMRKLVEEIDNPAIKNKLLEKLIWFSFN